MTGPYTTWLRQGLLGLLLLANTAVLPAQGNRLAHLAENSPYHVGRDSPKLITPQWVGEKGVEAVVILAIDDMRDPARYEAFLRPVLQRLKKIDGRAPVSIMTNSVRPDDPQLQSWLGEGLSIEVHTIDHPCPLLGGGDLARAKSTYDRCVDLLSKIPGNRPVAFRMPCCDSLNTVSPRFFSEIFNRTTPAGRYLQIDTSVFNVFTSDDPDIPRELVQDADGRERFLKYIPHNSGSPHDAFVNTIRNYPYPYIINRTCWEFPCLAPSDWEGQNLHGNNNPKTLEDWKAALDITVIKQGVMCLVFHPHGWCQNSQLVELINHAVNNHGRKIKFLNFREANQRLATHLVGRDGFLRHDAKPSPAPFRNDSGIRLLDINRDGYQDVVRGVPEKNGSTTGYARIWQPEKREWLSSELRGIARFPEIAYFGSLAKNGPPSILLRSRSRTFWQHFDGRGWKVDRALFPAGDDQNPGLRVDIPLPNHRGLRFRDLDNDGISELVIADGVSSAVHRLSADARRWVKLGFTLPGDIGLTTKEGTDRGLRFVDLNEDGQSDIVFSNHRRYGIWLFKDMHSGWSIKLFSGKRGAGPPNQELPEIVRADGSDNGFFVHGRQLIWQNEDTAALPHLVARRRFSDLLAVRTPQPRSPAASLQSLQARPGFRVELLAAEPLVRDPVALDWGFDGKLWVVEMGDYPNGPESKGKPGGRIRYLEDTNGDGRYDRSTLFLDHVNFPNGVMAWRDGVLISAAPEIFYAEDTNGDGKADRRQVLYDGFVQGNQQHRVNGFARGLDNWIYCANGDSGGRIRSLKTGRTVNINGRDFRIRPDTGEIDVQAGQTQFGRRRDDWGNWFGCNNSNPMWHYVLGDHYVRRNPHVSAPDPRVHVSVAPGAAAVFPISRTLRRFNDPAGTNRFTSACSPIIYRDDLYGSRFVDNTFVCEPVHNLIHREIMSSRDMSFTSRRATDEQSSEFLASSDNWFRPVFVRTGPDGCLWIADMYRFVIEHPKWIPADRQKQVDLRAGHRRGRIYRVVPTGKRPRPIPQLDQFDTAELVSALDSPNGWQRDTAQQLLVHRQDKRALAPLLQQARTSARPLCRLHSLCTAEALGGLTTAVLAAALTDKHPGVRRHAVRMTERLAALDPPLIAALHRLLRDPDPQVRLQLACSAGQLGEPSQQGPLLARLLQTSAKQRFLYSAVLSSLSKQNIAAVISQVLEQTAETKNSSHTLLSRLFAMDLAYGNKGSLVTWIALCSEPNLRKSPERLFPMAATLLDTLERRDTPLSKLEAKATPETQRAIAGFREVLDLAHRIANDPRAPVANRAVASRLLGRDTLTRNRDLKRFAAWLHPQTDALLQTASLAALGRSTDPSVAKRLIEAWSGFSPQRRSEVLGILLSRPAWRQQLVTALEKSRIVPVELDASTRQRLLTLKDATLRKRAATLLAATSSGSRRKLVEASTAILKKEANPTQGATVFRKKCSGCHQLKGIGKRLGADLAALKDKSPRALLTAILDPNRAVEAKFLGYVAVTQDGRTQAGMLLSESGNSVKLVAADGKQTAILRRDLESLVSTRKSFMPEGLEKDLSPQDLADVIAYVATTGPPPKTFPGNKPQLITRQKDGSLRLLATNCEIYGKTLVFESKYKNLGYWNSLDNRAAWSVDVPRAGNYTVRMVYACHNNTAGNRYLLQCLDAQLTGQVVGTSTWDVYKTQTMGNMKLPGGRARITLQATGKLNNCLFDLKELILVPTP
ncbi:MAG: dehydrogenase [Planctomyces sp.]|jgi:putative membrane-bound dehydrogenase-like protein|nr:dehydrogenase [Planctomyces sp.]